MTREEQAQLVRHLVSNVTKDVLRQITDGAVPAEWDGHELRHLLARHFTYAAFRMTLARKRAFERVMRYMD